MRWRWLFVPALLVLGARARGATAPAATPAVDLPVHDVTVFSDRARVVRQGAVTLPKGASEVMLPTLPATIDPSSVRLDATGAKVRRVTVVRANQGELPRTEAEAILQKLEALADDAKGLQDGLDEWNADRTFLGNVTPAATPGGDATHPPMLLEAAGWTDALGFFDLREAADDEKVAELGQKLVDKRKEIAKAAEEARRLAGEGAGTPGYKVLAVVDPGAKSATFELAYVAMGARWYPTYDVRYDPDQAKVDVAFGGLVSQSTGEDWTDANLVLSTAIPASTATLPKLSVWKIGERDRFIPTPVAAWQPAMNPPAPPAPWAGPPRDERTDAELRQALYLAANSAEAGEQVGITRAAESGGRAMAMAKANAPARQYAPPMEGAYAVAPPPPPSAPEPSREMAEDEPAARPMAMPMALPPSYDRADTAVAESYARVSSPPTEAVAFGAPRGWQPPYYAADLPAALAGGYTFVYRAAKPETVRTGGEAHKVALFSQSFPSEATVRILPALSKSAYLVAEITNGGDKPMLKGRAHLFVGSDLVGDAEVPTTAAGQKVTLPLGVDEAIKIERNVKVVSSETGLFSKDDVSAYETTIEVANPRRKTVHALVEDQVPVAHGEHVSVKVDGIEPQAAVDAVNGLVDWKVDLAPGSKSTFTIRYSITRPKDWKLGQSTAPTGTNP